MKLSRISTKPINTEAIAIAILPLVGWIGLVVYVGIGVISASEQTFGWGPILGMLATFWFGLLIWSVCLGLSYVIRKVTVDAKVEIITPANDQPEE